MSDPDTTHVRLGVVGIVCASLFAALLVRLWYLQFLDDHEYKVEADTIHLRTIHEQGPRGRILDRKGRVLVDNRVSRVVGLDHRAMRAFDGCPTEGEKSSEAVKDATAARKELFARLAVTLSSFGHRTKAPEIERLFCDVRYGPNDFVPIVADVDEELEVYLAERQDEFPGIGVKRRSVRVYPYGRTAAHLLGYVGRINETELEAKQEELGTPADPKSPDAKTYGPEDEIGKNGIEASFEEDLRGTPGNTQIQVDARGAYIRTTRQPKLAPGNDVWLTIDIDLQRLAEEQLASMIASRNPSVSCDAKTKCNASDGAVVIMDPRDGSVLALASHPGYDPAELVNGISTDLWLSLTEDSRGKPMFNRALAGTFAPGSTFKLVTAHAALDKGFITRDFVYNDAGVYRLEGCTAGKCEFQNAGRVKNYATNLTKSLIVSSDTYYYRIGDQMWRARDTYGDQPIQDSAFAFGFGERTGIALASEAKGRIGTPKWLAAAYAETQAQGRKVFDRGEWRVGDSINLSVGQGLVDVTPLQLVNAYATFANGGTRWVPHIVSLVSRPRDMAKPVVDLENVEVIREYRPEPAGKVTFRDPGDYLAVYQGLQGVTARGNGTAEAAFSAHPPAWPVAGKTGTAQVSRKADTSIFVGFGPADGTRPAEYAITAIIPQGGFGGEAAAPLAASLLKALSEGSVPPAVPSAPLSTAEGGTG